MSVRPTNRAPSGGRVRSGSAARLQPTVQPTYAAERYSRTPSATSSATVLGNGRVPVGTSSGGIGTRFLHQQQQSSNNVGYATNRASQGRAASTASRASSVNSRRAASPLAARAAGDYSNGVHHTPSPSGGHTASQPLITSMELIKLVDKLTLGEDAKSMFLRFTRGLGPAVMGSSSASAAGPAAVSSGGAMAASASPSRNTTCVYGTSGAHGSSPSSSGGPINASPRQTVGTMGIAGVTSRHLPANTMAPAHSRQIPLSLTLLKDSLVLTPLVPTASSGGVAGRGYSAVSSPHPHHREPSSSHHDSEAVLDSTTNTDVSALHRYGSTVADTRRPSTTSALGVGHFESPSSPSGDPLSNTVTPAATYADPNANNGAIAADPQQPSSTAAVLATSPIVIDYRTVDRIRLFPSEIEIEAKGFVGGKYYTEMRTHQSQSNTAAAAGVTAPSALLSSSCLINIVFADKAVLDLFYRLLLCKTKGIVPARAPSAGRSPSVSAAAALSMMNGGVSAVSQGPVAAGQPSDYCAILPGQPLLSSGVAVGRAGSSAPPQRSASTYSMASATSNAAANAYHDPSVRYPDYVVHEVVPSNGGINRNAYGHSGAGTPRRDIARLGGDDGFEAVNTASAGGSQRASRAAPRVDSGRSSSSAMSGVTRVQPVPVPQQTHESLSPQPIGGAAADGRPSPSPAAPHNSGAKGENPLQAPASLVSPPQTVVVTAARSRAASSSARSAASVAGVGTNYVSNHHRMVCGSGSPSVASGSPVPIPLRTSSGRVPQRNVSGRSSGASSLSSTLSGASGINSTAGVGGGASGGGEVLVDGLTRDERKQILIEQLTALKAQQQPQD